jgi:F-type H+-transporting ATPase subunit delta
MRTTAARRFAQAAFELATRDGAVDAWRKDLALAAEVASNQMAARTIDSPAVPLKEREELVRRLLKARIGELPLRLALVLTQSHRFALLPQISADYDDLVRESRGIVAATVWSPRPLTEAERTAVTRKIEQISNARVELKTESDPALIGGVKILIGDLAIDASVSGRLGRLRRQLVHETS